MIMMDHDPILQRLSTTSSSVTELGVPSQKRKKSPWWPLVVDFEDAGTCFHSWT